MTDLEKLLRHYRGVRALRMAMSLGIIHRFKQHAAVLGYLETVEADLGLYLDPHLTQADDVVLMSDIQRLGAV